MLSRYITAWDGDSVLSISVLTVLHWPSCCAPSQLVVPLWDAFIMDEGWYKQIAGLQPGQTNERG